MPVINTNLAANTALRYLNTNAMDQSETLARIASGKRIVSAADDAAGLAVSTRMTSDITTLDQAGINAAHGVAVLQTADGGLSKIGDVLQRMKALATQALSGAVTATERGFINTEFQELLKEVDAIATSTKFNGEGLISGSGDWVDASKGVSFLLGTNATSDALKVVLDKADATTLTVNGKDVTDQAKAKTAADAIDVAIGKISAARAKVGSFISRFKFRAETIAQSSENLKAANSKVMDADIAKEQSKFTSQQVLTNAAVNALAQSNAIPKSLMSLFR